MSTSTLIYIQTQMNFYAYPIIMVFGSTGNMFIFIFFHQKRQNPCSIYLMHAAITNLMYSIDLWFLSNIFPVSYYDQTLHALILCKSLLYITTFSRASVKNSTYPSMHRSLFDHLRSSSFSGIQYIQKSKISHRFFVRILVSLLLVPRLY